MINSTRSIYVIFHDDVQYPFSRFIKKGFRHVFAIERQQYGWVCFDPNRNFIGTDVLPVLSEIDMMPQYVKNNPNNTILHVVRRPPTTSSYPKPGILSCVGIIQYLLGIYWPHVITPHMLYTKLLRNDVPFLEVTRYGKSNEAI